MNRMNDNWQQEFAQPGAVFRGKTFWSWNGKLDKEELMRQLLVIKEMGFGGFFMHSRTGLQTEYLSEEWFDLINSCADEAEKMGLEAWLYDEDRWPSGTAGGMVTANPEHALKFLYLKVSEAADYTPNPEAVAVFSCRLNGIDYEEFEQISPDTPESAYAGKQILEFIVRPMNQSSFYNGYTYVDTMSREAIDEFIRLTHEKYKSACGPRLGKSIKGIFTDEPHRGPLMETFSIEMENAVWNVPWTPKLFDAFRERFGYELPPRLPELFLRPGGEKVSQVRWHYVELLQQLFMENFIQPIQDWCEANELLLTGHFLHEDNLTAQTAMSGSLMRFYELIDYPGIDVLSEGNRSFWVAKQLASAARQTGKHWLLSELYGCTGWQFSFENHKSVGDWQALFGINLRCHHLSWYTMEGESKRDYPASIFYQSAWWRDYKYVEDYFARIGVAMSEGEPLCDILVLNPVESVWAQVYPGWSDWLQSSSPDILQLEQTYSQVFYWLAGAQLDFDYGDEEMVGRLYSIGRDPEGAPYLQIGLARYRVVLVAGMTTMRGTTLQILEEFIRAGGQVVMAGERPAYVDALPVDASRSAMLEGAAAVALEEDAIVQACRRHVRLRIETADVSEAAEERLPDLYAQMRQLDDGGYMLMLLNVNRDRGFKQVRVSLPVSGYLEEWDCASGSRTPLQAETTETGIVFHTSFAPSGERLYRIAPAQDSSLEPKPSYRTIAEWTAEGPFDYRLTEPNVCVLDQACYRLNGEAWSERTDILRADIALRDRFVLARRGGEMVQPWFAGKEEHPVLGKLELRYEFMLEAGGYEAGIELVLERPELFTAAINGHSLDLSGDGGWWVDPCFRKFPLPEGLLVSGRNEVTLAVEFQEAINLEAIYLLGPFGVRLEGSWPVVTALPEKLEAGDVAPQGLPFYGAGIVYRIPVAKERDGVAPAAEQSRLQLSLDSFCGAYAKAVDLGGTKERMMAWQPFEADITDLAADDAIELELMLTRRNTFGPLHQVPLLPPAYGPFSFVTEGDAYTKEYALLPSGLLEPPVIKARTQV